MSLFAEILKVAEIVVRIIENQSGGDDDKNCDNERD